MHKYISFEKALEALIETGLSYGQARSYLRLDLKVKVDGTLCINAHNFRRELAWIRRAMAEDDIETTL